MRLILLIFLAFFYLPAFALPGEIPLSKGMIIRSSVKIISSNYKINATDSLNRGVIIIEGNNITVDFNGAELRGSNDKTLPNQFYGCAVIIKAGKNITIKNANIRGFKVAVMGRGVENLTIQNCNFSYNYRQKLYSNRLREDVSDWMSYHHNEKDEWLRYGAGIYLRDCNKINVHDNVITGGQCGLMLTNCNDGLIYNNNFSFNSAIGIGMYRSSRNKILHNQLDFNVRGYSHGIFNRGQDSAGILVFDQCNENTFAHNSVTHGGDGFFLWAGQHTMDTGEGGCNDNILYRNDFSYAPTNGVEVTFSRNQIIDNIIKECDNGIWGGYSFNTHIYGNTFERNNVGIAIEHGQENAILMNSFKTDKTAIKLWARKQQPKDWGYAQKRDTRSRNYRIQQNHFTSNNIAIQATLTDSIELFSNSYNSVTTNFKSDSTVKYIIRDEDVPIYGPAAPAVPVINHPQDAFAFSKLHPGRKEIRITQWGPYDYRYPILWLTNIDSSGKMFFDILGPAGSWAIKNTRGVKNLSSNTGSFPSSITAEKISDDILIEATYTGESFITQFGEKYPAKKPFIFSFKEFTPQIRWDVKWYKWDLDHDPNKNYEKFKQIFSNKPVKTETPGKLDYTWWGEIGKALPADSFATVATGILQVPKGSYDLGITADDLVKVFIDTKLVIDFWDATKFVNDDDAHHNTTVVLDGQKHTIRVEHVENGGYATLIFTLARL
ncbi:MAG TPA: right-handed parallel beta-helix repeat-containing protein [Chitinophagaceae bacterium]|nr:right-handed parallel beta-helix repeat-containing protein [Chitinophagaceae bacterium]